MRDELLSFPYAPSDAADRDVFVSSSARYLRNLEGLPFPRRASREDAAAVREKLLSAVAESGDAAVLLLEDARPEEGGALVERSWAEASEADDPSGIHARAVAVRSGGAESCFVNGSDHLRLRVSLPGLACLESFGLARAREAALDQRLRFAASFDYGYLTAHPDDAGAALRLSACAFLPGILKAGVFERVARELLASGIEARFRSEGADSAGTVGAAAPTDPFVELSARVPLGSDEAVFVERFSASLGSLAAGERKTRERVFARDRARLEDSGYRAAALLRAARLLPAEEASSLLADLRAAVVFGAAPASEPAAADQLSILDSLRVLTLPALIRLRSREKKAASPDECRADLVRGALPHYLI